MFSSKPTHTLAIALTLALTVPLTTTLAVAPAGAQELPGEETTPTPEEPTEVTEQLGDLVVHSYEYNDGVMTITATWQGRSPTTLTLTEMIEQDQGGATQISFKRVRMLPDEKTEITIELEERSSGTAAAMLTTPQSVENAQALVLQSGDAVDRGPIPFNYATMLIAAAAIGGAGLAYRFTRKEQEDESDADRRERIA